MVWFDCISKSIVQDYSASPHQSPIVEKLFADACKKRGSEKKDFNNVWKKQVYLKKLKLASEKI